MRSLWILGLLLVSSHFILGQARPRFTEYQVREVYKGKNAPAQINKDWRMFRTRLKWAVRNQKPDFAGRYILTFWGCGASCIQGAAIDAKTGKVSSWGFSIVNGFENIVSYKLNSSLIVFHGARGEDGGDDGNHYYRFDGKNFIHLMSVPTDDL